MSAAAQKCLRWPKVWLYHRKQGRSMEDQTIQGIDPNKEKPVQDLCLDQIQGKDARNAEFGGNVLTVTRPRLHFFKNKTLFKN